MHSLNDLDVCYGETRKQEADRETASRMGWGWGRGTLAHRDQTEVGEGAGGGRGWGGAGRGGAMVLCEGRKEPYRFSSEYLCNKLIDCVVTRRPPGHGLCVAGGWAGPL